MIHVAIISSHRLTLRYCLIIEKKRDSSEEIIKLNIWIIDCCVMKERSEGDQEKNRFALSKYSAVNNLRQLRWFEETIFNIPIQQWLWKLVGFIVD